MRLPSRVAAIVAACVVLACGDASRAAGKVAAYERENDFEKLKAWVLKEQSFAAGARSEALATIARHREETTAFSDAAFYMEVRRIVGLAGNGHSNVTQNPIFQSFGLLPVRTYWFSDGLYIVRAQSAHADLLGARIAAIDGTPIAELERRLKPYHGGHTGNFRRYTAADLMLSPALMHAVGLARDPGQLTLVVTDGEGRTRRTTLAVDPRTNDVRARPWRYLNPTALAEPAWATLHRDESELPVYLQGADELYRYTLLQEGQVAYIQLRTNFGRPGRPVEAFVADARQRLERDRPRAIVLDNRHNPGGDLGKTADFALALPSLVATGGRVYVITGSSTFSAGIYTSFFPKASGGERTIVVGEHVGDWTRFWAETGPAFALPDSGWGISYSLRVHDIGEGCHDLDICHMSRDPFPKRWNLAVGSLAPDWPVETTFEDFAAGRDRPLERILAHVEADARSLQSGPE